MSTPSSITWPQVRAVEALDTLVRLDLPEPEWPTKPITSPAAIERLTLLQRVRRVGTIAQRHVRTSIAPRGGGKRQQVLRDRLGRRVEDVAEPGDRDLHLLEILPELRKPEDRLHDLAGDHVEGDELADGHRALDHRFRADEQDQRGRHLGDILDRVLADRAEHAGIEGGAHIGGEPLLPLRLHDRLDARRFQGLRADDRFDEELLRTRAAVEFLVDELAQHRADERGDEDVDGDRAEHDERQLRRNRRTSRRRTRA